MKLKNRIIFWIVLALLFVSCVQSLFGFVVFFGLLALFHRGIIQFYKGDWYKIQ
ncbi:hypothetical protein ES703_59921 [subsurface metagenome]